MTASNNSGQDLSISLTPTELRGLEGQYTATFTAAGSCAELPAIALSRTYTATVQPNPSYRAGFLATLSGANVASSYDQFSGTVADDAVRFTVYSWYAFTAWLEDQPVIERLDANTWVSFMGTALTTEPLQANALVAARFAGTIRYCPAVKEPKNPIFPLECAAAPVECTSSQHRLALTRN